MATSEKLGDISDLMSIISDCKDRSITSLSEYTKKTMITSRAYIEDSISREDGILPIMKFVNQLLGGFVFTAMGMNNIASGGRTVREMASMISTEDFHDFIDTIKEKFGDKNVQVVAAQEDNNGNDNAQKSMNAQDADKVGKPQLVDTLFTGRLVEVWISDGKGGKVQLYFYVQVMPYVVNTPTIEQFISTNVRPDFWSRWAKFKAGEIKFWRDLVFEVDLVKKRKKALKADREGILREVEDRKQNQILKAFNNFNPLGSVRHNSASSILVVSRRTIDKLMKDDGTDYRRYDVRQKIMNGTMSLMMVVYDPNYNTVDLYLNGISNPGNYSIDQIKESVGKGTKDAVDLKTLMTILSSGQTPRF